MAKQEPPKDFLDWLGLTEAPRWGAARPLGALFSVVLILLFFAALLAAFAELGRAILRPESGGGIGAGALIVALLGAPFLIWNTVIKHKALGYQKEGLITDRIAKMVEQLGAEKTVKKEGKGGATVEWSEPNIEVRIGALYALERIAQDSVAYDKGRDHIRLMQLLCAYVRHNAPVGDLLDMPAKEIKTPRPDIQVAIDVIKRRSAAQRQIEAEARYRINLGDADLDGCDLSEADLTGAVFTGASLAGSDFRWSNLTGASFFLASLKGTLFKGAKLRGVNFSFAEGPTHADYGLQTASIQSIRVVGAKLPDFRIDAKHSLGIFGSRDTEIHETQRGDQEEALAVVAVHINDVVQGSLKDLPINWAGDQRLFLHWSPFEAFQGDSLKLLMRFDDYHGLIGWPFEDP